MVEFALIALPFFVIIFGIIDFSIIIFDMHSANAGSRASARFVGTGEIENATDCPMDFDDSSVVGSPAQIAKLKRVICMTKNRSHLSPHRIRVLIRFEQTNNPVAAVETSPQAGNSVVICMMTRVTSLTRLFSVILDNRSLQTTTRARLEGGQGFDYATLTSGGERPLPGATWSACYHAQSLPAGWTNGSPAP